MADKKNKDELRAEWIFDWKRRTPTPVSTWLAIVLVAGVFIVGLVSLRVKLVQPVDWEAPQASVIHLRGEGWSRIWQIEARAKGPFPSRFEPEGWPGTKDMQKRIADKLEPRLEIHQPRLLPFPDPGIKPLRMAHRGEPVLPRRPLEMGEPQVGDDLHLVPVIRAMDGIEADELPESLPPWDEAVTEILSARPWRFLVELGPSGHVRQSVSLVGGQEQCPEELTQWLRGVIFPTAFGDDTGQRWVAIAVEFENRRLTE